MNCSASATRSASWWSAARSSGRSSRSRRGLPRARRPRRQAQARGSGREPRRRRRRGAHRRPALLDPGGAAMGWMAIGTGATAAAFGDTALGAETDRNALTSRTDAGNVVTYVGTWAAGDGTNAALARGRHLQRRLHRHHARPRRLLEHRQAGRRHADDHLDGHDRHDRRVDAHAVSDRHRNSCPPRRRPGPFYRVVEVRANGSERMLQEFAYADNNLADEQANARRRRRSRGSRTRPACACASTARTIRARLTPSPT